MYAGIELFRICEKIIEQFTHLPPEIDKLDWLKTQNINLTVLTYIFSHAAKTGQLELLMLISDMPDIDPAANNNYAIGVAAEYGHLDCVKFLCTRLNVDPAADDNYAIRWASMNGHLEIVSFLSAFPTVNPAAQENHAIRWASENGHLNVVKFLSTLPNVDPAAENNYALRWAAKKGHVAVASFLASLPCYNPFTPGIAIQKKNEIIALLKKLDLESNLASYHINANPNIKFLFFSNSSQLNSELVDDVKKIIVQNTIDLDYALNI